MHDFGFIIAGFVVGLVVGLTGVGGGSLMTPVLIFYFNVKPYMAVGTDLLFAAFTKLGGTLKFAHARLVDWRVVAHLSMGSIPAALTTLFILKQLGTTSAGAQKLMTTTLGVALLLTAATTLYSALRGKMAPAFVVRGMERKAATPRHWSLPLLFGAAIGTMVTLTSVGAGAVGVVVLMMLYPMLPLPRIVAADIAYAVPLMLVAGLGHASLGNVDWSLLTKLLAGSLPGIWLGSHLVSRIPERAVRFLLSALLAYTGVRLIAL